MVPLLFSKAGRSPGQQRLPSLAPLDFGKPRDGCGCKDRFRICVPLTLHCVRNDGMGCEGISYLRFGLLYFVGNDDWGAGQILQWVYDAGSCSGQPGRRGTPSVSVSLYLDAGIVLSCIVVPLLFSKAGRSPGQQRLPSLALLDFGKRKKLLFHVTDSASSLRYVRNDSLRPYFAMRRHVATTVQVV